MPSKDSQTNFALIRERVLAQQQERPGKNYWRSLEEFADTDEFREFMEREYPQHAEEWDSPVERRTFLKIMGASLALAGLSGCVYQPAEKIIPYVTAPEEMVPGKPLFFATAFQLGGVASALLVRSNEGRPTKVEGNPDHPNSRYPDRPEATGSSATDLFAQASVLDLYDPDRSQTLTYREEIRPWTAFVGEMRTELEKMKANGGAGLRFLTETITSPTLYSQIELVLREFPGARWHQYEPTARDNARAGAMMAFGQPVNTLYRFEKADRILSIDSDFLACGPGNLWYGRDFASKRRLTDGRTDMNRLYVVESTATNTGAKADHKLSLRPSEIEGFARAVAAALGVKLGGAELTTGEHANWINALVRDLQQSRGRSIVIAGDEQSPAVHALAHAMNEALGNAGQTVIYTDPVEFAPANFNGQMQSLRELVQEMDAGAVELLVVVGGNPVYNAPADLHFADSFQKARLRVHLSLHKDETSELSHWHVPAAHYLESWSDARSYDGTVSIIQPLIAPLYEGRTAHELLAVFSNQFDRKGYDIVRDFWKEQMTGGGGGGANTRAAAASPTSTTPAGNQPAGNQRAGNNQQGNNQTPRAANTTAQNINSTTQATTNATAATPNTTGGGNSAGGGNSNRAPLISQRLNSPNDFEMAWRKAVHDGFIGNTALPARQGMAVKALDQSTLPGPQAPAQGALEIVFRTDPTLYDGRFANNGWLQELPKPLTKLTWDNAALISPNTARRLGLANNIGTHGGNVFADTLTLEYAGRKVSRAVPVWVQPGHPDDVITVHLGHGRRRTGKVGTGVGFNAYEIRTSDAPWFGFNVKATPTGAQYELATTQLHFNMENRDPVRASTLAEYLKNPEHIHEEEHESTYDESMYPRRDYKNQGNGYAWGMAIDITSCVGCSACVVACQSENNIPVVGKEQVMRSREMHWIRIDSYFGGADANNPVGPYFMPVPCMHCEQAPCEPVCPVHATVHDAEGTNNMVYNRCVGTRYCSNNCPYKVRRFNFLLYQDWTTPTYQLMRNPEVSVRSRGVMEKCTYCIQRIQSAKIESEKEGRHIADGEIVTACQAVCPADAIVFGDINDPDSRVSRLKREERNYSLLAELNTQPRTTYLSALRNPNPEIGEKA